MRSARTVAIASMALFGGCFARCALFPSTDGLTGGVVAADAGVSDVLEASVTDADDAGDAKPGRFCDLLSPKPKFCDDFDDTVLGLWTSTDSSGGASVTRDGTDVRSAPNALLAVTPGGAMQVARVVLKIPSFTHLHVAYDVRIDKRGTYAEIGYVHMNVPNASSRYYFRASALPTAVSFTSEATVSDGGLNVHDVSLTGSPTFVAWTHVELDLELGSSVHTATIRIDGAVAGTQDLESDLYLAGAADIEVGLGYTSKASTEFRIRHDNAVIDWQ